MSQPESTTANTAAILEAMDNLGPADASTIAEKSGIPYSTVVRKLREWGAKGEIRKTDRGSKGAHWSLLPTDEPLPDHLHPGTAEAAGPGHKQDVAGPDGEDDSTTSGHRLAPDGGDDGGNSDQAEETDPAAADGEPDDYGHDADDGHYLAEQPAAAANETDPDEGGKPDTDPGVAGQSATTDTMADDVDTAVTGLVEASSTPPGANPADEQETPAEAGEDATAEPAEAAPRTGRRPQHYFHDEGLALLRAHPDRDFTVGEMCKLIAAKEIAAGAPAGTKVSTGAMANAMHKAAASGEVLLTSEKKPAKFQAA